MADGSYPASISQRVLWLATHRSAAGTGITSRQYVMGDLDPSALQRSLTDLRARHEALRTRLTGAGPSLGQRVDPPGPLPIEWACADPGADEAATTSGVAARVRRRADGQDVLQLSIDHLLTDAWSYRVISSELAALYDAYRDGHTAELPPIGWQYRHFAEWQNDRLRGETLEKLQASWLKRIAGTAAPALPRPAQRVRRRERTAGVQRFRAGSESATALSALSAAGRTTKAAAALSLFFIQLWLITGQEDIAVGSVFANRTNGQSLRTVGLFANVLPLRMLVNGKATIRELLGQANLTMAHALAHQELPMQLLPTGALPRETAGAINNIIFHVQPPPVATSRTLEPVRPDGRHAGSGPAPAGSAGADRGTGTKGAGVEGIAPMPPGSGARFDLELSLVPRPQSLGGAVRYATDRFSAAWAETFRTSFCDLIELAAADPDRHIGELSGACSHKAAYDRLRETGDMDSPAQGKDGD